MTRFSEQGARKLTPLLRPGEGLVVGVEFSYPMEQGPDPRFEPYMEGHGRSGVDNLSYKERATNGYLGVTDSRLIVAKSPILFKVKPRHVYVDAGLEECLLDWYDMDSFGGVQHRVMHFRLADGRIATALVALKGLALIRLADGVVAAFGERAVEVAGA